MKKTTCIRLVLITAALAGCERGIYPGDRTRDRVAMGDLPDSTNSCPFVQSALPPDDYYFGAGFGLQGYYSYCFPVRVVRVVRAGFGRIALGRVGGGVHS